MKLAWNRSITVAAKRQRAVFLAMAFNVFSFLAGFEPKACDNRLFDLNVTCSALTRAFRKLLASTESGNVAPKRFKPLYKSKSTSSIFDHHLSDLCRSSLQAIFGSARWKTIVLLRSPRSSIFGPQKLLRHKLPEICENVLLRSKISPVLAKQVVTHDITRTSP